MTQLWYYVQDGERIGPVAQNEIIELINTNSLNLESYVWRKGFSDWMHISDVEELVSHFDKEEYIEEVEEVEEEIEEEIVSTNNVEEDAEDIMIAQNDVIETENIELIEIAQVEEVHEGKVDEAVVLEPANLSDLNLENGKFFIRAGQDRGTSSSDYGPFSFAQLKKLLSEKRINDKTLIFSGEMKFWRALGTFTDFEELFKVSSSFTGDNSERRQNLRKPFVARMLFANRKEVFEGLCRDVSIGGMQVLLDHYPGEAGENISINVHPENTDYNFVADGKVVRVLDGRKGFSFRFLNLTQQAKNSIDKYISEGN